MSLINKVLRDLDERRGLSALMAKSPKRNVQPVAEAPGKERWVRHALLGFIVVAAARFEWIIYEWRPAQVLATTLAFQAEADARSPLAVAALAKPPEAPAAPAAGEASEAQAPAAPEKAPAIEVMRLATSIETPIAQPAPRRPRAQASAPAAASARATRQVAMADPQPHVEPQVRVERREPPRAPVQRAEAEFQRAMGLLNQGRVSEAESGFFAALQADGQYEPARQALVAVLLEQRRLDDAIPVLQQGLVLNGAQPRLAVVLARIQAERRDYPAALATLERAKAGTENDSEYNSLWAAVLQRLSRHREAADHYRAALRAAPDNGASWIGLAISLEDLDQRADAAEAYRRALGSPSLSAAARNYAEQKVKELR